jgi:Xaa-Pro aminopeptidase
MFAELERSFPAQPAAISNAEYRARQQRLFSQLRAEDLLLICAHPVSTRSNDVHFPYRNHSDMLYLCGWFDPESIMMARQVKGEWKLTLFVQSTDILSEIWEGRRPGVDGALRQWPIDEALAIEDAEDIIDAALQDASRVQIRQGLNPLIDNLVTESIQRRDRARQHFGKGPISVSDPSSLIAELRLRKSESEIDQMRYSAQVSAQAHIQAMKHGKAGIGEWAIEAILECVFKYGATSGNAYPCIVGCGENATILHYTVNDCQCNDGEVLLIDAASEYRGYAADITRSWPISGKFTEAQADIYQIVLDAQLAAIDQCRVGNPYNAPHEAARQSLAQGLIDLGIISQTLPEALDENKGQLKNWYMHNTGHWIGLDVHDVGIYKPDGKPRLFEEGMVITVEPGLYFGAWRTDVDCPEKYADIGIRIEDDVLITSGDPDVLSSDCPKTITDIESIIGTA